MIASCGAHLFQWLIALSRFLLAGMPPVCHWTWFLFCTKNSLFVLKHNHVNSNQPLTNELHQGQSLAFSLKICASLPPSRSTHLPTCEMSNWLFGISGLVIIEMTKLTHWDFDFITCIYSAGSDYEDGPGRKIHFSRRWKVWIRSLRWRKSLWWCSGWQKLCEGIKGLRRKVWT